MGCSCESLEDSDAEVSGGNKGWALDHSCDVLDKNLALFCLCSENPVKLDLKTIGWQRKF